MSEPGFFSFHKLVSTSIIKTVYLIGAIVITLLPTLQIVVAAFALVGRVPPDPAAERLLVGIPEVRIAGACFVLLFGNLIWRLICEGWILLFSIHELLAKILTELRRRPDY